MMYVPVIIVPPLNSVPKCSEIKKTVYTMFCTRPTTCKFWSDMRTCLHVEKCHACWSFLPNEKKQQINMHASRISANLGHPNAWGQMLPTKDARPSPDTPLNVGCTINCVGLLCWVVHLSACPGQIKNLNYYPSCTGVWILPSPTIFFGVFAPTFCCWSYCITVESNLVFIPLCQRIAFHTTFFSAQK